ncbi:putative reverse transcriptase domain-containing protein [Tanacetum coccineum]
MVTTVGNNHPQRQNTGGQNVARAYVAGNNEERKYEGTLPLCNKCKLHHVGPCTIRCGKCNKVGHLTRNCRVTNPTTPTQRGQIVNQRVVTCFECGAQGHYRKDCPKIKNQNRGNKASVPDARGRAYALGGGDVNPGSNTVTDNHPYALMLVTLLNLDDEDLETNSWDYGLRHRREEKKSKLSIISCEKAQKYIEKGCQLFLAQVTVKENKDKSEEKRLEDVPTGEKEEAAFQTLKQKLCSAPILALPEGKRVEYEKSRWLELLSDYDCELRYHPGKANVVANALSRKSRPKPLRVRALVMTIGLNLPTRILNAQVEARKEENYGTKDLHGMIKNLEPRTDGTLCLKNRSWIPLFGDLRALM